MSKKASRKPQPKCPYGKPLKSKDEFSMELCRECLETGIPTERSKVPIPKDSCLGSPDDLFRQSLDHLLWLINWWGGCAGLGSPQDAEYLAARLEELAAKIRRTV